jgi:hypothetical protein
MENQLTDNAASSPAPQTFEIPSDPKANLEWRKTGELPASAKEGTPKEASTPSKENASAANRKDGAAEPAAASATATQQEKTKQQSAAATRLNELLADLKKAGLSPEELKTFKREAQQAASTDAPAKAAPEKTANPQELVAPVKPKMSDKNPDGTDKYKTWEELDEAKDAYHDAMATYRAKLAVAEDRQARAAEAQQQTFAQKVTEAKARYGDQTEATIGNATRAILSEEGIHLAVKDLVGGSPVLVDVMYALGSDAAELAAFVDLAKTNPAAAIRKFVLLEHLTTEELAKGSKADKGAAAGDAGAGERGEDGKFVSQKTTPAKQRPAAPPPPEELSTRGSAPPDPIDAAVRNGDFRAFKDAEDRKDLARRRGA